MKRLISLLLACMLVFTVFAACGDSNDKTSDTKEPESKATDSVADDTKDDEPDETPETGETTSFLYVIPGDEPKEVDRAVADVNAKMAADGVGIELELKYFPWDVWDQKINLMLSTGEVFDAFHVMNDRVTLANYASRGALADISDAMGQYGSNIKANVPELAMKDCQINGDQYGIPAFWVETALNHQGTIRADVLRKYDLEMPTTFDELTEAYKVVFENWDGNQKPCFPSTAINERIPFFFSSDTEFCIYDNLIYVNQDGTITNYYETDTFKEAAKNARTWYELGFINPDVLTLTSDQVASQLDMGDWFAVNGTMGSIAGMKADNPDLVPEDLAWLDLTGGAQEIRPYGVKNLQAVPASSENPENAVKFFDWVYANQENFDLFIYGSEGTDYNKGEGKNYEPILDATTGQADYSFAGWMAGNINYGYTDAAAPPDTVAHLYSIDESAVDGIAAGFSFDASNVQTQLADVQTQISAVLMPMAWGVTDYDSGIDEAIDLLKKAGVDDVIAEFKVQLDASK